MLIRGRCLVVTGLLATVVIGAPPPAPQQPPPPLPPPAAPPASLSIAHADADQIVLQVGGVKPDGDIHGDSPQRKLHGRFLHITDLHPDQFYKPHTSTESPYACHRSKGPAGAYGAETSDCDSPFSLVNATLDWIGANLKDSIDFVVWTGDSARHDSDPYRAPRHNSEIIETNRIIADKFVDAFSDSKGLAVPVIPTLGNNDIYPHNVLMPGPNDILRTYTDIWKPFIPEEQRHSFHYGGWFYVEVIPNKLAVFSLNTLYFFDRNAGIDDCASPSEPGYKHFEWLRVQLQFMRDRGMKAILMGHVPPARTEGKQLWDETCWQKYTLWLQQYRDVVTGALYGHMNIDHFILQDTRDIDITFTSPAATKSGRARESLGSELSAQSRTDYLMELRDEWSQLPDLAAYMEEEEVEIEGKKKKKKKGKKHKGKGKKKIGGPWAERYQLSLVSPSIVPNYFPSIRVFEYNITGLEHAATWVDTTRASDANLVLQSDLEGNDELEFTPDSDVPIDSSGKKRKGKGKKGKKPKDPPVHVPDGPSKTTPPGPAYSPQPLTFTGFTQYYANLTYINNDLTEKEDLDEMKWDSGRHSDKKPKHEKPRPNEFTFEVEYNTFEDKIYKLKDLTVKSFIHLGHRIGQTSPKSESDVDDFEDEDDDDEDVDAHDLEDEQERASDSSDDDDDDDDVDAMKRKGKKGKGKKKKHKGGKKHRKTNRAWLHFLKHAFVSTASKEELKDMA
ncbi:Endopolyphosphatase [Diatrype stigma]|uniref:Endopolyphosphatase n=1 Tax=Diatrype stigma TaxID=117547 RepID=A0AAN9USB3_9PEZI